MPSFARHSGSTVARDDNRDGVADDRQSTAAPVRVRPQTDDRNVYRSGPIEEPTTQRIDRRDTRDDLPRVNPDQGRAVPPPAPAGPRPRTSLLATLSLIAGVAAALLVLSGPLAGYGIGLGGFAVLLAVFGIAATRRRHVAGKSDALLGLLLGLGAVVVGILALTGSLPWLGTDVDTVGRTREWLDSQFVNRF